MKRHPLLAAIALVLVAGCAAAPPAPSAAAASQPVCTREYGVGTMLPKSHCDTAATEAERQQMIDTLQRQMPPGGNKATGAGG